MPRSRLAVALVALSLAGCGLRAGYRRSWADPEGSSGIYAGPWLQLALSTASEANPVGSSPYWVMQADYAFARGPDFATVGTGVAIAPDAYGWHNAVTLQVAWEIWNGMAFHASLCDGYGNWGVVMACARWSTKGYWGADLGFGLNPTRLGADIHEKGRGHHGGGFSFGD